MKRRAQGPRFVVDETLCIRCGACVADCPVNILYIGEQPPAVAAGREQDCIACQHCLAICPTGAVSVLGKQAADSLSLESFTLDSRHMIRLVRGRRSVRHYLDENLEAEQITALLETAWYAPTSRNARHVLFSVIDDRLAMQQFRRRAMEGLAVAFENGKVPEGFAFFGAIIDAWQKYGADPVFRWAPHLLVASAPSRASSAELDAVIALSSFDLLAQSQGIGTLWNGLAKNLLSFVPELRTMLHIPTDHQIGFAMSFGRPAVTYARTVQHDMGRVNRISRL